MTPISEAILKSWQVRRTPDQKTAFIQFLQSHFPELQVQEHKKNRNLVLGDLATAKVVLTAHYDTCSQMPFPNFITPLNIWIYLGYQILIIVPFIALMFLVNALVSPFLPEPRMSMLVGYFAMLGAMYGMLLGGKPNTYTANDNTSGVITLLELYQAMTPEQRSRVALVFFDNEESGLKGSKAFCKAHKEKDWRQTLLFNFDCVSDGDTLLFVANKPGMAVWGESIRAAFPATEDKAVRLVSADKAFYPSDQASFPTNCAVSSMKTHKVLGLYMDKIHTPQDRYFDTRNIEFLTAGTLRFLNSLPE
jgi:hypothetical protein